MKDATPCGRANSRPHEIDELLEMMWIQRERGEKMNLSFLREKTPPPEKDQDWLKKMAEEGFITLEKERVDLTSWGVQEASDIIRRHRLTERLFADVFRTREEIWERDACALEHKEVLTEEAVSAICTFLGHPPTCPHGSPIPPGKCCLESVQELKPYVTPLTQAGVGGHYRIVFIAPTHTLRLDRLAVLGIHPGQVIRIHQKKPSYVIRAGSTDVALDPEIARDIYVKNVSGFED